MGFFRLAKRIGRAFLKFPGAFCRFRSLGRIKCRSSVSDAEIIEILKVSGALFAGGQGISVEPEVHRSGRKNDPIVEIASVDRLSAHIDPVFHVTESGTFVYAAFECYLPV